MTEQEGWKGRKEDGLESAASSVSTLAIITAIGMLAVRRGVSDGGGAWDVRSCRTSSASRVEVGACDEALIIVLDGTQRDALYSRQITKNDGSMSKGEA